MPRLRSAGPTGSKLPSHRLRESRHQRLRVDVAPLTVTQLDVKPDWGQRLTAIGSLAAVAVAVAALLYTNEANRQQQNLTEQGQITDRFSKAVEQLGSDNIGTRVGGVYALQRIMRDSPADQTAIIEVLSAFVRANAVPPLSTPVPTEDRGEEAPSPHDVQAAVIVLARRPNPSDHVVNLTGARLSMPRADLSGVDLHGADLSGANLGEAALQGADLTGAVLDGANLDRANLVDTRLDNTKLVGASLNNATLTRVSGTQTIFRGATLTHANFHSGNLRGADLGNTDLTDADLGGTDLTGAILTSANLTGANLRAADLTGASLTSATLTAITTDSETRSELSLVIAAQPPNATTRPQRTGGSVTNVYSRAQRTLVLDDDLTSAGGSWRNLNPSTGACSFGAAGLRVSAGNYYHECYGTMSVRDFTYEAELSFGTARVAGIFFRQSGPGSWYYAAVGRSGTLWLGRSISGTTTDLDLLLGHVVSPDVDETHRLAVTATGTDITVYFDGVRIGSVTDSTFSEGTIGVFTDGGVAPDGADPRGETVFRGVRIWKP